MMEEILAARGISVTHETLRSGRTQAFATWADVTGVAMTA
jgi:transposase-like protein